MKLWDLKNSQKSPTEFSKCNKKEYKKKTVNATVFFCGKMPKNHTEEQMNNFGDFSAFSFVGGSFPTNIEGLFRKGKNLFLNLGLF